MFFRILPPVRFFLNTSSAIKILRSLNDKVVDDNNNELNNTRAGVVRVADVGFTELMGVIKENNNIEVEIESIALIEQELGVVLNYSPGIERVLQLRSKDDKEINLVSDPFDPGKPIRELQNWVDGNYRKQLAYWMLIIIAIWLVLNTYILVNSIIS